MQFKTELTIPLEFKCIIFLHLNSGFTQDVELQTTFEFNTFELKLIGFINNFRLKFENTGASQ